MLSINLLSYLVGINQPDKITFDFGHIPKCEQFLNYTTGIVHELGQYSKKKVLPETMSTWYEGDVFGFGPLLYDNS